MAAAAGAWRGLGVGADQEGRRRAAREREACGMGLLEADLEGSDRRRRGSGDLDPLTSFLVIEIQIAIEKEILSPPLFAPIHHIHKIEIENQSH